MIYITAFNIEFKILIKGREWVGLDNGYWSVVNITCSGALLHGQVTIFHKDLFVFSKKNCNNSSDKFQTYKEEKEVERLAAF